MTSSLAMFSHLLGLKSTKPNAKDPNLHAQLIRQVEYYLSEKNLRKDDFLKKNLDSDHCTMLFFYISFEKLKNLFFSAVVKLDVLMTFPKIQAMTNQKSVLRSSLQKSKQLELDRDLESVRRKNKQLGAPKLLGKKRQRVEMNAVSVDNNTIPAGKLHFVQLP